MAIFSALFSIQNSNNLVRNVLRFHLGRFGHHQQFNVHIANHNTVFIFMDCPAYGVGPNLVCSSPSTKVLHVRNGPQDKAGSH